MRVGMVVNNLSVSGGYQKLVLRLTAELQRRGHEIVVYSCDVDPDRCYPGQWPDVEVVVPVDGDVGTDAWESLGQSIDPRLDALVVHDEPSFAAIRALRRRAGRTPRIVWMLNNELGSLRRPVSPRALLQATRRAFADREPGLLVDAVREERRRRSLRAEARAVDAFAVYDQHNARLVRRFFGRAATVVLAGADVEAFEALERTRSDDEPFAVLSVGVLFPHRRYEDLIAAVDSLDFAVELTIVGVHSLAPDYAAQVRAAAAGATAGRSSVTFVEYASQERLDSLYASADVFAFVNDGHTWGIAVFEAIAAGVPVVITDNIGAADLIADGRSGLVVPPRDPSALAAALMALRADRSQADAMAQQAKRDVLPLVRWPAYADRIERLLQTA